MVILPNARRLRRDAAEFEHAERRFVSQERLATLFAGISGFYMIVRFDRWLLFAPLLFVAKPLFLDRWVLVVGPSPSRKACSVWSSASIGSWQPSA